MDRKIDRDTLAALVESEPCLWYPGHDHFHRKDKKDEAWDRIVKKARGKGIVCDVKYLKCQWRSMRDGYKRSRNPRSGSAEKPSGFNQCLSFLDHADVGGVRSSNIDETGEDSDYYQDENGRDESDVPKGSSVGKTYEPKAFTLGKRTAQEWETPTTKKRCSSDSRSKKEGNDKANERKSVLEAVEMVKANATRLNPFNDEYSHFGEFVGHVLRDFGKEVARSRYPNIIDALFGTNADNKQDQPPHPREWSPYSDEVEVLEEDKQSD
ncbi:unnamed protein product [Cylicocyclus nassatus]|uniref:MADF domain-containing protein n=1 Tax=Cylicocyclus nassatus TaxID=53992 RepID=A0AA36HA71_CYLNA|nr:unnamed protein product [Cylicocyclus nassatus]